MYKRILFSAICLILLIFGVKSWIDNQEKSINQLININENTFKRMHFEVFSSNNEPISLNTHDVDIALQLEKELSQYRIKKIKEKEFSEIQQKSTLLTLLTIEHEGIFASKKADVFIIYTNVVTIAGKSYKVLNGPIDRTFLNSLQEQIGKEMADE